MDVVQTSVQDIPILSNSRIQQCPENSTPAKADEPIFKALQDSNIFSADQ